MTYIEQDKNKKEKKYKEENYTFKPKINKRNNSHEKLEVVHGVKPPNRHKH